MDAETAYLFRHALLRDTAYQLQLPGERARLHLLALELMEQSLAPLGAAALDAAAEDLAYHARNAATGHGHDGMAVKEAEYLWRAARYRERAFHIERAVQLYERLSGHPGAPEVRRAEAMQAAGAALANVGWLALAESWFLRAHHAVEQCGARILAVRNLCNLTLLNMQLGRFTEAEELQRQAGAAVADVDDPELQLQVPYNQAVLLHQQGKFEEARALARRCRELADKLGSAKFAVAARATAGVVAKEMGLHEEAEALYCEALEMARGHGLALQEVSVEHNRLGLLIDSGRAREAAGAYPSLLRRCAELGARRIECLAMGNFAVAKVALGADREAEETYQVAIALARDAGIAPAEAAALGNLAGLYNAANRFAEAEVLLARALELHRVASNRRSLGGHGCNFAMTLLGLGRHDEALRQWREAVAMLEELADVQLLKSKREEMQVMCRELGLEPLPAGEV